MLLTSTAAETGAAAKTSRGREASSSAGGAANGEEAPSRLARHPVRKAARFR